MQKTFTSEQLAERWQCSDRHVRNLAVAGKIPGVKLGSSWRFPVKAIERYEEHEAEANLARATAPASSAEGKLDVLQLSPLAAARRKNRGA